MMCRVLVCQVHFYRGCKISAASADGREHTTTGLVCIILYIVRVLYGRRVYGYGWVCDGSGFVLPGYDFSLRHDRRDRGGGHQHQYGALEPPHLKHTEHYRYNNRYYYYLLLL